MLTLLVSLALVITLCIAGCTGTGTDEIPNSTPSEKQVLHIATTTSLYDTGLLDYLRTDFENEHNVDVKIVSAGTGKAIEYGMRGDVDVLMIHDRVREDVFLDDGYGINHRVIAYNYFVIVGPESDPAGIKGMLPEEAVKTIMEKGQTDESVVMVSRGDNSGTHAKEQAIWKSAGYEYEEVQNSGEYYLEAGTGMGATLVMANEKQAYTLSDIGTFLAYKGDLELVPLVDEGDILLNVYSAMQISPEKFPDVNTAIAKDWINYMISEEVQDEIGTFRVDEFGQRLFNPSRGAWETIGVTKEECEDPIP